MKRLMMLLISTDVTISSCAWYTGIGYQFFLSRTHASALWSYPKPSLRCSTRATFFLGASALWSYPKHSLRCSTRAIFSLEHCILKMGQIRCSIDDNQHRKHIDKYDFS